MEKGAAILILDTAGVPFSVAVAMGGQLVASLAEADRTLLASNITVCITEVLRQAGIALNQLDAIAINRGPGSYTGLRIGYSVVKGLCYGMQIPMIEVSGHVGVAQQLRAHVREDGKEALLLAAFEARQAEIYLSGFDLNLKEVRPLHAVKLPMADEDAFFAGFTRAFIGGDGGAMFAASLKTTRGEVIPLVAEARWLAGQAENAYLNQLFADIATCEPLYFKPPNITTPRKR